MKKTAGWACFVAFVSTVFLANWAIDAIGIVPVGFGLMAPAAVYFVGIAFVLRDFTQEILGVRIAALAIIIGAALSALVAPQIALASGVAFLVSEFTDLAIYTPLRKTNWPGAVAVSGAAGLVVDSVIFLSIAFGSLEFLPGQIVGKAYMTIGAALLLIPFRNRREELAAA